MMGLGGDAGGALIGGLLGFGLSGMEQALAAGEATKARRHQEHMFKNRYKWTVADLKRSGLNKNLAFGGKGVGPGNAAGTVAATQRGQTNPAGLADVGSKVGVALMKSQREKNEAEAAAAGARNVRDTSEAAYLDAREDHERVATARTATEASNAAALHDLHRVQARRGRAALPEAEFWADYWREYGPAMAAGQVGKAAANFMPGFGLGRLFGGARRASRGKKGTSGGRGGPRGSERDRILDRDWRGQPNNRVRRKPGTFTERDIPF